MGIAFIILGTVCLTIGIVCLTQSTNTAVNANDGNKFIAGETAAPKSESLADKLAIETKKTRSEEIGQAFENFIVNLLADSRFKLLDRTQDSRSTEGVYAESCMNPDLHIEQMHTPCAIDYYVECKYRSRWYDGKIQFEDYQIKRYKEFQGKHHRKVLFAIGVGGTPTAPQELLVIPLDKLSNGAVIEEGHGSYRIAATSEALYSYVENYFRQVFAAKK
jgi:hypothetical protein